jgi:2-iminobutanoate/2-iminopropanoate deaminase
VNTVSHETALERIVPAHAPPPRFRYTPAVRVGERVIVSGMVALDPASGALCADGVGAQMRRIFDNLCLALPDYGVGLEDLCIARVYLAHLGDFAEFNAAWERQFEGLPLPARTTVCVAALPLDAAIEIEFEFARPLAAVPAAHQKGSC